MGCFRQCTIIIIIIVISCLLAQSHRHKYCTLGVMSKVAHSLTQKLLGYENVSARYFASSLQRDWQPLEEIVCFHCNLSDSFCRVQNFRDEFWSLGVPTTSSFYGNRDEVMCGGKVIVFCDFHSSCLGTLEWIWSVRQLYINMPTIII